jgi:Tol biopolymer transport system component
MFIVHRNGIDTQLITSNGSVPSWSPDGTWLVYSIGLDIYKVNIKSKEKVLLYSGGTNPTWRWDTP